MSKISFDEDGLPNEPCLSCGNLYVEDIWNEWCCDVRSCPFANKPTDRPEDLNCDN